MPAMLFHKVLTSVFFSSFKYCSYPVSYQLQLHPLFVNMVVQASLEAMQPTMALALQEDYICKEFCVSMDDSRPRPVMDKEKQISVDPMSLKQSARKSGECERNSIVPSLTPAGPDTKDTRLHPRLPPPPMKSKFLSTSLPGSATSSPRNGSLLMNLKKWRNQGHALSSLARQHSSIVSPFSSQGSFLRKSKSCGEGRSSIPADEFDMWAKHMNDSRREIENAEDYYANGNYEVDGKNMKQDFKCGACLFLPGFAKGKPVRPRKEEGEETGASVISRTVSLEKFECGSWASSTMISNDEESGMSLYFDLPMELIRNNVNDADSPVATAFVFERDRKGVLKKNAEKPIESGRHVRFSTSNSASPTCISPRLLKAREDFNAYLQQV